MKLLLHFLLPALLLFSPMPSDAQSPYPRNVAQRTVEADRISANAPLVFLGRPLSGEYYQDSLSGLIYQSTLVQVLEVLRGQQQLQLGTIELNETLEQTPMVSKGYKMGGYAYYSGQEWGIYFCTLSTLPPNPAAQVTDNLATVSLYQKSRYALLWAAPFAHGTLISGLYHNFYSENSVHAFLRQVSNLKPLQQPAADYPTYDFHRAELLRKGVGTLTKETLSSAEPSAAVATPAH
jgi:hypothetical protein